MSYDDHFGELRRFVSEQSALTMGQNSTMNQQPLASIQTEPALTNFISLRNQPSTNPVQISRRILGKPPLGPDAAKPSGIAQHPQIFSGYPLGHPLIPRSTSWPVAQPHQGVKFPAPSGPLSHERKSKRGKPTARRSLQAMFDAAATDESSYDCSSRQDTDTEGDVNGFCSSQNSVDSTFTGIVGAGGPLSPLTPSFGSMSPTSTPTTMMEASPSTDVKAQVMTLSELLMSEKGLTLTLHEVKSILYQVIIDLTALHDMNVIHRAVCIDAVTLTCLDNIATASLAPHAVSLRLGPNGIHWGPKEVGTEAFVCPEAVFCPSERCAYTAPTDIWALGVLSFGLLGGGNLPFGNAGLGDLTSTGMPGPNEGVAKLQAWMADRLRSKIQGINHLSHSQEAALRRDPTLRELKVLGFDLEAISFVLSLLHADPACRPSARALLSHPWLSEVAHRVPSHPPRAINTTPSALAQQRMAGVGSFGSEANMSDCDTGTMEMSMGRGGGNTPSGSRGLSLSGSLTSLDGSAGGNPFARGYQVPQQHRQHRSKLHREGSVTGPFTGMKHTTASALSEDSSQHNDNKSHTLRSDTPNSSSQEQHPQQQQQQGTARSTDSYSVIGHVSRQVEVMVNGQMVTVSALHAVFSVPGRGAMMSAEPVGYAPLTADGKTVAVNGSGGGVAVQGQAANKSLLSSMMQQQQQQQ